MYQISSYWEEHWSQKAFDGALDRVFNVLDLLTRNSRIGKVEQRNMRSFIINKHLKVYYRADETKIVLLSFSSTRTNPDSH